jgi:hypothetical protein
VYPLCLPLVLRPSRASPGAPLVRLGASSILALSAERYRAQELSGCRRRPGPGYVPGKLSCGDGSTAAWDAQVRRQLRVKSPDVWASKALNQVLVLIPQLGHVGVLRAIVPHPVAQPVQIPRRHGVKGCIRLQDDERGAVCRKHLVQRVAGVLDAVYRRRCPASWRVQKPITEQVARTVRRLPEALARLIAPGVVGVEEGGEIWPAPSVSMLRSGLRRLEVLPTASFPPSCPAESLATPRRRSSSFSCPPCHGWSYSCHSSDGLW